MAGAANNFVRPHWLPADFRIPRELTTYKDVKNWVAPKCHQQEAVLKAILNDRIVKGTERELVKRGFIVTVPVVTGGALGVYGGEALGVSAAAMGAEKGAELGLLGGIPVAAACAVGGAVIGAVIGGVVGYLFQRTVKEKVYEVGVSTAAFSNI